MKALQKVKANFNMNTTFEIYFWKSEWEQFTPTDRLSNVSLPYLAFRFVILAYFIIGTVVTMTCTQQISLYFIFLTNWSFTLQLIYAALFFFRLVWVRWKRANVENRLFSATSISATLPWAERLIWVGVNLNAVVPYIVTLGYFIFLFHGFDKHAKCEIASDSLVHALNSPVALIDLLIMAIPIRISHMIFPIITGFLYVFFSAMYEVGNGIYAENGDFIYPMLNWRYKPGVASIVSIMGIIAAGLIHLIMGYGVYRIRLIIARTWGGAGTRAQARVSNVPSPTDLITSNSDSKGGLDNSIIQIKDEAADSVISVNKDNTDSGGGGGGGGNNTKTLPDYNTFSTETGRVNIIKT